MDSKGAKKILFVGHAATRSGAPILLLNLLRWFKQNSRLEFEVLLMSGGVLESEFAALAPTTVLTLSNSEDRIAKLFGRFGLAVPARFTLQAKVVEFARLRKIGLVYGNTVAVADEVAALAGLQLPLVWHIHEMPYVVRAFLGSDGLKRAGGSDCTYIAASDGVGRGLQNDFGITPAQIKVIHAFIPVNPAGPSPSEQRAALRKELDLPPDAFVAGMCGTVEWRKGGDWFITVARHLVAEFPGREIYLVWIGAPVCELTGVQIEHELRLTNLAGRVRFTGEKPDARRYMAALDAFMLPSREDPFPLVMLEGAAAGLPVVCFNHSGGGPEFVGDDAGIVVDYGDTMAMARALVRLSEQPALREKMGAAGRQKVEKQFTIETQAPKILQLLGSIGQNGSARPEAAETK